MKELQLNFISDHTIKRLFRILNVIENSSFFTLEELANINEVTPRTISNDINYLREYFEDCVVITYEKRGYVFVIQKNESYRQKKQNLLKNECMFKIIGDIFKGKLSKIDELAHHYHFSESTFRRLLKQTEPVLKEYRLNWSSNPLDIEGTEANLRIFFKDFYYDDFTTDHIVSPDIELHELLLRKLDSELGDYEIGSSTTPIGFYYTLYIGIQRARIGKRIIIPNKLLGLAYQQKDFLLFYTIRKDIEKLYDMNFSKEEFAWIYFVTVCDRTLDREDQEYVFYKNFNQGNGISELTNDFFIEYGLLSDENQSVSIFLHSFFLSRQINHIISPTLNKEMIDVKRAVIRSDYTNYCKNLKFLTENLKRYSLDFEEYLEDVCVSLTLYSNLIFNYYDPKKNIFLILEGNHFVCQYIKQRIINEFGDKHSLIFVPLQYLKEEELILNNVDLVVTNSHCYPIEKFKNTKYLILNSVPDERDWLQLRKIINPYQKDIF